MLATAIAGALLFGCATDSSKAPTPPAAPVSATTEAPLRLDSLKTVARSTVNPLLGDGAGAIQIEQFVLDGPVSGVVARVDLTKPSIQIKVALADDRDPDGDGPAVGQLSTTTAAAHRLGWALTMNASFFAAVKTKEVAGRKVSYFIGNGAYPVGWHFSEGKLYGSPRDARLRATVLVMDDGRVSLQDGVEKLPPNVRYAVSGNAMMLKASIVAANEKDTQRHPRSAIGLAQDGKTMLFVTIDGRQTKSVPFACGGFECPAHSRGATMLELAQLMKSLGAHDAINLDGGGSSAMVARDPVTGAVMLLNKPSDISSLGVVAPMERAVVDVIGVEVK